jgi:heat shock protein HslJ
MAHWGVPSSRGILLTSALLAVACGGSSESEPGLLGRSFFSETIAGIDVASTSVVYMGFGSESLGISADCNNYGLPYRIEGERLQLTSDVFSSTAIGCSDHEVYVVIEFLKSSPLFELDGARLTLSSESARMTLLDVAMVSPDRPLIGSVWSGGYSRDWNWDTPGFAPTSMLFGADGSVEITTPCEQGSGTFEVTTHQIEFGEITYDGAACADPNQEAPSEAMQRLLSSWVVFEISARTLFVTKYDDRFEFLTAD